MATERQTERQTLQQADENSSQYPQLSIAIGEVNSAKKEEIFVVDINNSGMGIICTHQLKVGQKVSFSDDAHGWDLPAEGTVMWTFKSNDGFRAGIKFS